MQSDLGLLLARVYFGAALAAHGTQKAFGWFGGHDRSDYIGYMKQLGFPDPELAANAALASEIGAGALIALGALGPVGPAAAIGTMLVAMGAAHAHNGFFTANNGVEFPGLYAAGALALSASGFGDISVDNALGLAGALHPRLTVAALLGSALVAGLILARRVPPTPTPESKNGHASS